MEDFCYDYIELFQWAYSEVSVEAFKHASTLCEMVLWLAVAGEDRFQIAETGADIFDNLAEYYSIEKRKQKN